jgi:hypothetical protein
VKARSRLLAAVTLIGLGLTTAGCPNDTPYVAKDDAGVDAQTFTSFVIDLVNNQTNDSPPASYDTFKDLPDPDETNTGAYDGLFH